MSHIVRYTSYCSDTNARININININPYPANVENIVSS